MARKIEELPEIDLNEAFSSGEAFDRVASAAHENGPFARSGRGLEVLGYQESVALLRDRRLYSDHMGLVEAMQFPDGPAKEFKKNMLLSHGRDEYRTRIRQALTRVIGPNVIEEQRSAIRQIANGLVGELDRGQEIDLLNDYAFVIPARLFCSWFGAPVTDAKWVADVSDRILRIFSNDPSQTSVIIEAYDELFPYVERLIANARAEPQDNLLGHFVREQEAGNLSEEELFHVGAMFNEASTDNTANGIATAIGLLLQERERWQNVVEHPQLIPVAIEESLRLSFRINTIVRYALEDLEFEGLSIPKGTPVFMLIPAAHRDPSVFENPLVYDLTRAPTRKLLDFGGGVYTCIGQRVATIEMEEAVNELVANCPNAQLGAYGVDTNFFANTVSELKVSL